MKNKIFTISLLIAAITLNFNAKAQGWKLDDTKTSATMPFTSSPETQDAGKALFSTKACIACHGEPFAEQTNSRAAGLGPNLGSVSFQDGNTDGAIFYKIKDGNGSTMSAFGANTSDEDIWKIVSYIRTFKPGQALVVEGFNGKINGIELRYDLEKNSIVAKVIAVDQSNNPVTPAGVAIKLQLKRYFGYLNLSDKALKTNASGEVVLPFDQNLPSDTAGKITVKASIGNDAVKAEQELDLKKPWKFDDPTSHRHLWGQAKRTPLWLLLTYLGVTGGIWLGIFYIVFQLLRIYSLRER